MDHDAVRAVYGESRWPFVTHEFVLVEAFSLLTKRVHKHAALTTIGALRRSPRIEIIRAGEELLEAGWKRCEHFADKEWDWVDCMSFEVMEARGMRSALSLDHHFTQAGFALLVPSRR